MPKKIKLEDVISKLPPFVQIKPETYRGIRYPAKFLDLEYNEEFTAIVGHVIKLQHGCKSRADKRRSEALDGKPKPIKTPLNEILEQLPPYLEIDPESYRGMRYPARFYDKEFKVWFEGLVCNVLRHGKGYCKERKLIEFKKAVTIPLQEVERRLFKLYQNSIKIVPETYISTNDCAQFVRENGTIFKDLVFKVLQGDINSNARRKWNKQIIKRDQDCQICHSIIKLRPHHIYSWTAYPEKRFDLNNGICLCEFHHKEFHKFFGYGSNDLEQFLNYINKKGQTLSSLALDLKERLKF